MNPEIDSLRLHAHELLLKMRVQFEASGTQSYVDDFYKRDVGYLNDQYAPGASFLWLIHPCGTHLGRIDAGRWSDQLMSAAAASYLTSYGEDRLQLHLIDVSAQGEAKFSKITFAQLDKLVERRHLNSPAMSMPYGSLMVADRRQALVLFKQLNDGSFEYRFETAPGAPAMGRADMLAAVSLCWDDAKGKAQSFWHKPVHVYFDGQPAEKLVPSLGLPPLTPREADVASRSVVAADSGETAVTRQTQRG